MALGRIHRRGCRPLNGTATFLALLLQLACGGDEGSSPTAPSPGTATAAPVVTTQPASQTVTAGSQVTFTAAATGNPTPTVQWQSSTDNGSTFSNVADATSTSYTLSTTTADGNRQFRAVFTNSVGTAATNAAILTVNAGQSAPVIVTHPSGQTGTVGSQVTFTAAASGNPAPTAQWQTRANDTASFADISGATATSYTLTATAADNNRQFRAVFTNTVGTATTDAAVFKLSGETKSTPVITEHPVSQAVTAGTRVTFTAAATGSPTPTVQWQASSNGGASFLNIDANAPSYTFTARPNDNGWQFRAVFTNSAGSATTNAAILTVTGEFTPPIITANPASQTVAAGTVVTFSAAASGAPEPTVLWETRLNTSPWWGTIPGATATSYTLTATQADDGRQFRAVFRNLVGQAFTSEATLAITCATQVPPTVTVHPRSRLVAPEQYVSFIAAATGCPVPTVQWQTSMDGGTTWANEPGATAWEWDLGARYHDLLVRAVFTNVAGTAVSNTATLTILHPPAILAQPADLTVVAGATVTFTASARCIVEMTRKWTITGGSITDTVDGTTRTTIQSFTAKASDNGKRYGVQFCPIQCWDLCCTSTREATLTVASPPEITAHPASRTVAPGTTVTFTAAATGNPTPTAQWQVSTDGGATYADIAGATSAGYTFTAAAIDNGKLFRAKFINSVSTAYTNAATLTVI